jgi:ferredoxin
MTTSDRINTLEYYAELCIGCEMCIAVCPHGVFAMNGRVVHLVQEEACMECGACQINCPTGAIAVESGVGCAEAMIRAALTGGPERCGDDPETSGCGTNEEAEPSCPADSTSCCG